jgi:hypothetical protein
MRLMSIHQPLFVAHLCIVNFDKQKTKTKSHEHFQSTNQRRSIFKQPSYF